jgi:GH25 family lysozyme M1 (1,4-beta-N-acetylmuramidase)
VSPAAETMFANPHLASPLSVLDVSEWQARVQWLELKRKAHIAAVYVRASLGETRDDRRVA